MFFVINVLMRHFLLKKSEFWRSEKFEKWNIGRFSLRIENHLFYYFYYFLFKTQFLHLCHLYENNENAYHFFTGKHENSGQMRWLLWNVRAQPRINTGRDYTVRHHCDDHRTSKYYTVYRASAGEDFYLQSYTFIILVYRLHRLPKILSVYKTRFSKTT